MTLPGRGAVLLLEDLSQQRLPARALAAVLRRAGLPAYVAHFGPGVDPATLVGLARRRRPRLIVFSILFSHYVAENLALATRLRTSGVTAHSTLVGPLPTFAYRALLAACPELDSVLRGEAEASIVELATRLTEDGDWRTVPGLAYRAPDIRANPLPLPVADLDALPFPIHDEPIPTRLGLGFATVAASRGCYHACSFCLPCAAHRADPGPAYRLRGIANLLDEIEQLYRAGTRLFLFDDEQFLPPEPLRAERVGALEDGLQRRGLDIAFTLKCRADDVDRALFGRLKALGLIRAYVGVESGCQISLDLLTKGVTPACNARALSLLDDLGIVADFRSLLFHPWSTLEAVRAELTFLQAVAPYVPTPFTFREVIVYPGTPLAAQLAAEGRAGSASWQLAYTISDPRAELLRRLVYLLFTPRDRPGGLHERFAEAWYDVLLGQRFGQDRKIDAGTLRATVVELNRQTLAVWQEMLAFVEGEATRAADLVNECAARWATAVGRLDLQALEALVEAGT